MLLKTYDSDIFNNWIQTDWIDGVGGITELTSIDITANDGKLTMDALNLQQKVYNMLNRIAVSGGTYRDWLETVYTAGNEPLGTLAGRGVTTERQKGGHIRIKVTEPCYIMCICSITPRIDYGQGTTWDSYLETMEY